MCKAVLLVLVVVALVSRPVFAEDAPVSLRIGSRVGLEGGTTIQGPGKGWNGGALTLGLDADKFIRPYLLGADVGVAGGPFTYGAVRAGLHAGIALPSRRVHTFATVGLGWQWLSHICYDCRAVSLPYAVLRGELGYAWNHVEIGLWSALLVDLGRDHVSGVYEYDIGGYTVFYGLSFAFLARDSIR